MPPIELLIAVAVVGGILALLYRRKRKGLASKPTGGNNPPRDTPNSQK